MPSFRDGSFGFVGRSENGLARFLVSIWHPDRHNGNERLRHKAEEKNKQINEAWETFQTAPRSNVKPSASRKPNWEDLRERLRREQEKQQAKKIKKNGNVRKATRIRKEKSATKSNAVKFPTIRFLWGILLYPFVKVIGALLIITTLYVYLRDTGTIKI